MNKRGQVLVAFVLLLPILFMLIGLIIDCGYLYIEKRSVDNNIKDALEYGLKHIEEDNIEDKLKKQLNLNIEEIEKLNINIVDKIIEIKLEKNKKSIFTSVFSKHKYEISSHYKGYIKEDKIVIRKV